MTQNKRRMKFGLSAMDIIGTIFMPLGAIFMAVGIGVTAFAHANPDKTQGDPMLFLFIFGGIGLLFFLLGGVFLLVGLHKRSVQASLVQAGNCVTAQITSISQNYSITVNGRSPFVAECSYTDPNTGVLHIFRSRNLFFDPTSLVMGCHVPVYVNPDNDKQYYVDIDAILPKVESH